VTGCPSVCLSSSAISRRDIRAICQNAARCIRQSSIPSPTTAAITRHPIASTARWLVSSNSTALLDMNTSAYASAPRAASNTDRIVRHCPLRIADCARGGGNLKAICQHQRRPSHQHGRCHEQRQPRSGYHCGAHESRADWHEAQRPQPCQSSLSRRVNLDLVGHDLSLPCRSGCLWSHRARSWLCHPPPRACVIIRRVSIIRSPWPDTSRVSRGMHAAKASSPADHRTG